MSRYAAGTEVGVDRSRAEIERTLERYGASHFAYGWSPDGAVVQFSADGRYIKFSVTMPSRDEFTLTETGRSRSDARTIDAAWDQAKRQRWRALALVIKAKLEAVESGIATFEDEFMAYTVLPSGATVSEWLSPQIVEAYASAEMPREFRLALGP